MDAEPTGAVLGSTKALMGMSLLAAGIGSGFAVTLHTSMLSVTRAGQSRTAWHRVGQGVSKQHSAGQGRAGRQGSIAQSRVGQDSTTHGRAGQYAAGQGSTTQGRAA